MTAARFPLLLPIFALALLAADRDRLDLNGSWQFRLDPQNEGLAQRWFDGGLPSTIQVPGAWQAQGFGAESAQLRHDFAGAAWYERTVAVPAGWQGGRTVLRLGGAHRRVTVFVNGVELGGHDGFSAPFEFDITSALRVGAENRIVLRVENPPVVIEASPDRQKPLQPTGMLNYIGNWGGIFGGVELRRMPATRIGSVLVVSDVARRRIQFRVKAEGAGLSVRVSVPGCAPVTAAVTGEQADVEVEAAGVPVWSPEEPRLVTAQVDLLAQGRVVDEVEQRFGFRTVSTQGQTLLLNGRPVYLRGYGDDNVEVLTGFPPSDKAVFVERLKRAKSFGFNAVRFHSMVPPEAYFEAADEVGLLVMAELPAAYTQYFAAHTDFLKRELQGALLAYRNHPSLLSLGFGNEFNLHWLKTDEERAAFTESVAEFYRTAKELAPATLILSNDGFDLRPTDMVSLYKGAPADRPTVRHEFGQYYCSLPDPGLIDEFTGVMKPTWLEAKRAWVKERHLEGVYPEYVRNSQRLQQLGRKFQIERVRRDGAVTGYHYWLIVDYPGGTGEGDSWEEGWFDYFWRPKGETPEEGRRLNTPVLVMVDAGVDDRTLWAGERKQVGLRVSNYGTAAIRGGRIEWSLLDGATRVAGGTVTGVEVGLGAVAPVGAIELAAGGGSRKLELVARLDTGHGVYENRWGFWVFQKPAAGAAPAVPVVSTLRWAAVRQRYPWVGAGPVPKDGLLVTDELNGEALAHLKQGGRVWLMARQTAERKGVEFFPASGGALGTVVRPTAALRGFPQDGFCDLQFYNLLDGAWPLPVDEWPLPVEPLVGGIRTTSSFLSKTKALSKVAYAVEARVGAGRLLVTTLRLREHFDDAYPASVALFDALLRYAAGPEFAPAVTVPEETLRPLLAE